MTKGNEERDFEISFFEGVLKTRPDYVDVLMPLAEAYTSKGDYHKGLDADLRLAKLCPEDPTVYYNLACSYALTGKAAKAIEALQYAVTVGWKDFSHMAKDKDLTLLHQDPQFQLLINSKKR